MSDNRPMEENRHYTNELAQEMASSLSDSPIYGKGSDFSSIFEKKMATITHIAERIADLNNSPYSAMNMTRYEIAVGLFKVHQDKLFEVIPRWQNVYAFGGEVLHFKKMTTSNYIRVARNYLQMDKPLNIFNDDKWSMTQLVELCKIPVDEAKKLIADGVINYNMSVVNIREAISNYKNQQKQADEDMKAKALEPLNQANEDFHTAYNRLKAHLLDIGDEVGANELLPDIMDAIVRMYNAKLEVDLPIV